MAVVAYIFWALSAILALSFAYLSLKLSREKSSELHWRGIVKILSLEGVPASLSEIYSIWFKNFWALCLALWLAVSLTVWNSDHSFFVVIFPLLFYYFFMRFFLWQKEDLSD